MQSEKQIRQNLESASHKVGAVGQDCALCMISRRRLLLQVSALEHDLQQERSQGMSRQQVLAARDTELEQVSPRSPVNTVLFSR